MLPFPHLIFLQVDTRTKPKQENITNWLLQDDSFISCWLLVIMWKSSCWESTYIQPHFAFCIITCWSLHAFPSLLYCFPQHFHPDEDIHWLLDYLRPQRPFQSGGWSPPAAAPCTDSTAPSLSWSPHLHSICQVYMCLYLCCQNPSKHGSLPFLTHSVCWSEVISGHCVSPEGCWIHTKGETPLGCSSRQLHPEEDIERIQ